MGRSTRPEPGDRIGRYRVEDVLGRGGMGVVFAAHDEQLRRRVAIKLLSRTDAPAEAMERLRREGRALAQLSHENVVEVYEVGTHDGGVFVAMELVEGVSLHEWLQSATRSWTEVLAVLGAAGRGLAAAHAKGLVHRDFKPANVMVGDDGRVRVLDFGLARFTDESRSASEGSVSELGGGSGNPTSTRLTAAGTVMGTPGYMAPEQFAGGPLDDRSDQYAFCVTLYEALYGRRPYRGGSFRELRAAVLAGELGPRPDSPAPARLWPIVTRGLAVDRERRHRDMSTLLRALERVHRPRRVPWTLVGLAGIGVILAAVHPGAPGPCDGDPLADVWNDDRHEAVAASLRATALPYAEHAAAQVPARLDDYAARFRDAYGRVCGADDPRLDARMQCLHRARARVDATVEVLVAADATRAQRAVPAVAGLPEPADCLTEDEAAVPSDVAGEVASIRDALARAEGRIESGDVTDAVTIADPLVTRARATGFDPVVAETLLARGRAHKTMGDYVAARADLEDAFLVAQRSGYDRLATSVAASLVFLFSQYLPDLERARTWVRHGEGALARLDGEHAGLEGALVNSRGVMHERAGETREAVAAYARAVDLWSAEKTEELPRAAALFNLGNAVLDTGDIERTKRLQAQALAIRERVLGPDHPDTALGIADMSIVAMAEDDYERARTLLRRAIAIDEAALGPEHPVVVSMLINLATIDEELEGGEVAAVSYERAMEAARAAFGDEHVNVAIPMQNLGRLRCEQGRFEEGLDLIERSHATMVAAWGAEHPQVVAVLENLATAHAGLGRHDLALADLRQADAIAQRRSAVADPDAVSRRVRIGDELRALGRHEEAESVYAEAAALEGRLAGRR